MTINHFEAIENLLGRLELDFYSEPMRAELAAYRRDLELLLSASRLARSAGALIRRTPANGVHSAAVARRIAAARAALAAMRDRAELRLDGSPAVAWSSVETVDPALAGRYYRRAGLFLNLAAAEIRSGEAERPAPECSR